MIDETEIVHALLDVVAGVVIDVATLVSADRIKEHIEGLPVEDVFEGMDLIAEVDTVLVIDVEDRLPSAGLFSEAIFDEPCGPLGIWIEIGPGERAGEGDMLRQSEPA